MKKAYSIYQQRGYRTRLLPAAYRHVGPVRVYRGDPVVSMPYDGN